MKTAYIAIPDHVDYYSSVNFIHVKDMDLRDPQKPTQDRYGNGHIKRAGIGPFATPEEAEAAAKSAYLGDDEDGTSYGFEVWAFDLTAYE
jgi:hypothetical protein